MTLQKQLHQLIAKVSLETCTIEEIQQINKDADYLKDYTRLIIDTQKSNDSISKNPKTLIS